MSGTEILSHWSKLLEGLEHSPQAFYGSVHESIAHREIPDLEESRVVFHEGAMLGGKREYLRLERRGFTFDICGAPFGRAFFVSWWFGRKVGSGLLYGALLVVGIMGLVGFLTKTNGAMGFLFACAFIPVALLILGYYVREGELPIEPQVLSIPVVGFLYTWIFKPTTYYRRDTESMFEAAVHAAVLEVVDGMTKAKGIRELGEEERKPIMKDFMRR